MANDYYASRLKEITGNRLAAGRPVAQSYAKPRERYVPPVIEAPQAPSVSKPETSILEDIGRYVGESPNLMKALNIIGGPGGAAITQATNWADQNLTAGDFGWDVIKQFGQGTYEYAKENPLKAPLAPILGGLANLGAQAKSGEDLTKALYALGARTRGVDEAASKRLAEYTAQQYPKTTAVLGFGQELAIDPLNALTFGSGSVAKAGAKAAEKAAKAIAKTKNIKVPKGKVSKQLPEKVYEQTLNKYSGMETQLPVLRPTQQVAVPAQKVTADAERIARAAEKRGFTPEKARQLAQQATRQTQLPTETLGRIEQIAQANKIATQREIENAAKAARAASQNALISFDLPFTNITKTIVNKPKFLRKTADLAGAEGAAIVNGLFKVPQGLSDKAREKFLQSKQNFLMEQYGVTRAEDMTIEEVRDLQARFEKANIQEGKMFDLQTVYKPKIVDELQRTTVQQPFLLDEFLKDASPEMKDIVQTKLRSGMTPEQVIAELPASLRDVVEKGKKQVVPADRVPIPNAIATKLDEIFNYQQQVGQSLDYQTEFAKMVDLYNDPTMDKAKFADAVDSLLASSKAEVDRMDQAKFARQTQTAQQIASENKRLKDEYNVAKLAYKTAKANRALNKKQARTEATIARDAEYARQVAEYEVKLADIEAQQAALAKQAADARRAKAEADQAAERKARKQKQAKKLRAEQSANVSKVQAEKAPVEPEKVTEVIETYEPVKRYNNPPSAEAYRKINPTHIEEQIKVIDGGKPRISYVFHDPELLTEPVAKALKKRIDKQIYNFEIAFRGKNIPDEKAKELEFFKENSEKAFTRLTELRQPSTKVKAPVAEPKKKVPVIEAVTPTKAEAPVAKAEVPKPTVVEKIAEDLAPKAKVAEQPKAEASKSTTEEELKKIIKNVKESDDLYFTEDILKKLDDYYSDPQNVKKSKELLKKASQIAEDLKDFKEENGLTIVSDAYKKEFYKRISKEDYDLAMAYRQTIHYATEWFTKMVLMKKYHSKLFKEIDQIFGKARSKISLLKDTDQIKISSAKDDGILEERIQKSADFFADRLVSIKRDNPNRYKNALNVLDNQIENQVQEAVSQGKFSKKEGQKITQGIKELKDIVSKNVDGIIADRKMIEDSPKSTVAVKEESLIERLSQDMNIKTTVEGNNIKLQSGNVEIELPKKPKKKDIPLVIKQIEEAIKPEKPTYQAVPKVEPIKARTLPKAKRKELAELRKNLQPSGAPKVIEGLDKTLVKEINTTAKKLEKQAPSKAVELVENVGVMDIGVNKVIRGEQPTRTRRIPFNKLREEGAFVRDAGGLGPLQKIIRDNKLFKMFNARSLGTGNRFIDQYGALIQDTSTRISGESRFIRRDLVAIQKAAEGLRPDEMQAVQYVVENKFPSDKVMTAADKEAILSNPKIQKVAELTKNLLAYLGKEDLASGVVKGLRADYFPHLLKFDLQKAEEFKAKYLNDPDLKDLAKGLSQTSGFAKERTGLPTLAEYDDLVAELVAKRDNATNEGQIRRLDEKISELTDLFNRDTVSVLNSRIYQSVRSRAMRDLYSQMKADGMIKYGEGFKSGFTQLSPKQAGLLGLDKRTAEGGVYIKDEILKGLEKVEGMFSDEKMNAFVQTMDDVTRIWKLGTTVLIPKHYVNNLIGNVFNNGLAGVKLKSYKDAMSFLNKVRQNKLTPEEQKTALSLYRDGVIGQGINAEFRLTDDLPDRTALQRLSDWAQKTWYAKNVMHIGEAVDDWSRLALYLHSKEVNGSHKIATDAVRQFLFNYHEVTRADRFTRSMMMPFWLWMKNNIPLQFQQVLRQPRYYLAAEKIREATFEDDELQDQPDYIREKGFKLFGQNYVIGLPMYDLYVINGAQGTLKNVANMFGPIQTAGFELAFNKDIFTGAPVSKELGRRGGPEDYTQDDITNYLARQFGGYLGGEYVDYKKNVIDKEILTSSEQIERSLKGFLFPKPQLERQ